MTNVLPSNVSFRTAVSGKLFVALVLIDGVVNDQAFGIGNTKDEATANATTSYFDRVFDHRTNSKLTGLKWVHVAGQKAIRVQPEEVAAYVAKGFSEGRGHAAKPVAVPAVN